MIAPDPSSVRAALGEPERSSCLIRAGADVPLARVEAALAAAQLTLGPLSPGARRLTVGEWLSGPHAGLRAIPGGRLETAALALEAELTNGEVYRSHAAPRSAAGPDLDAALLGGGGAVGRITWALLRAFPRPTAEDRVSLVLGGAAHAARLLRGSLAHDAAPSFAELHTLDGRPVLRAVFANLAFRAHRDAGRLRQAAQALQATPAEGIAPLDEAHLLHEVEVGWESLPELVSRAPRPLGIYRIARESVVLAASAPLIGEGAVSLDAPPPPTPWLAQLASNLRGET